MEEGEKEFWWGIGGLHYNSQTRFPGQLTHPVADSTSSEKKLPPRPFGNEELMGTYISYS